MKENAVFEKNMEVLEKRYPDLAKRVRETKDNPNYKIIETKNGKPNLLIKKGSEFFMLYDNDDPEKYCKQYLESLKINYAPIVVFMGLGLGYHLDLYFKFITGKVDSREIIVFEKDIEIFRHALRVGDFRQVISRPNIHYFVGVEPDETYLELRTKTLVNDNIKIALKSLKVIPLPGSIILDNQYYQGLFATLRMAARQVMILTGNDSLDSIVGLESMLKNLKHIYSNPGINMLDDRFEGRPGVIVAAGPSLNKNMHLLRDIRDKALIISCDASFIPIMKNGIRPHMVASLERTPGVDLFFSGIENFNGIYFVALPVLMPETIDAFKGRKFIAYRNYSHFDWLEEEKGRLFVGISVANMAFKILAKLGCDPIILIGQDLAYAEDGDTHAKGDIFGSRNENIRKRPVIEMEGNNGKPVKSERMWEIMKYSYEEDIAHYNKTCVNATEGGARIKGTEIMPFREAIERYCTEKFVPDLILDEVYLQFLKDVDAQKKIIKIKEKAKETRELLADSIEEFQEALFATNQEEKEIIEPFLNKSLEDFDIDRLISIEKRFLDLTNSLQKDKELLYIMHHTTNAYDVCFSNELGFLRDIYSDEKCLAMARVRKIKDWFSVVGSFLVLTSNLLEKTEKELGEGLEGEKVRRLEG